jgi:Glycosyl hydrolase family 12
MSRADPQSADLDIYLDIILYTGSAAMPATLRIGAAAIGRHRSAVNGQATGAELMIWLNAGDCPAVPSRVVRVDHRRWYVYHWVTSRAGAHWNYIQIRAVRPVSQVRGLALLPIIAAVEKMGLIHPRWWMLNIESGFEIWHGGRGLQTTWFTASVRRR